MLPRPLIVATLTSLLACQEARPAPPRTPPSAAPIEVRSARPSPAELSQERPTAREVPPDPAAGDPITLAVPAQPSAGATTALPLGAFATTEQDGWPCARREVSADEAPRIDRRYVYGDRRACQLPVELAFEGTVGCPARVLTPAHGRWYDLQELRYDEQGRLIALRSNFGLTRYAWSEDGPRSDDAFPREREPGRLRWKGVGQSVVDVREDGRPLLGWSQMVLAGKAEDLELVFLGWSAARLDHVQHYVAGKPTHRFELVDDCADPIPETPNRGGELGVPLHP
ncbi:MAG: hypothetical protein R3B72_11775 [Polyangiaceae bacterium]